MLSAEIAKLRQRLTEREESFSNGQVSTMQKDNVLADMANTSGWEILKASIEKTINKLLEPGIGSESADLETIGAITLAREFTIEALQAVISSVESTKAAKMVEKADTKPPTETPPSV